MSNASPSTFLQVDRSLIDEGILRLHLDRPHKRNAINGAMETAIRDSLAQASRDRSVRVVLLSGEGEDFSAGADVAELDFYLSSSAADLVTTKPARYDWFSSVWNIRIPVVAAVQGHCLGAATELAAVCDLTVCTDDAVFGWPELIGGGIPSSVLLGAVASHKRIREYFYTARLISAGEARAIGIVNMITARDDLEEAALSLCRRILLLPQPTIETAKVAVSAALDVMGVANSVNLLRMANAVARTSDSDSSYWRAVTSGGVSRRLDLIDERGTEYWRYDTGRAGHGTG